MLDNTKWDEIDNKVKSLIYLSLGTEGTNIFHQRNPHTDLSKCTTDALVIQLQETFKEIRNETFDRFQFFRCTQNPGESMEQFHSRIKQKAALCNWENLEDSLVKSIFIHGMSNSQIQMDLLSEDRDPLETLQYAITRERGQENQQRISNIHALNPSGSGIHLIQRQRQQFQRRSILPTPPNNNKIPDCWKCGYKFIKGHLDNCPAKNTICNICKKVGHYAKMCRSDMPPRKGELQSNPRNTQGQNNNRNQQQSNTQQQINARRVRNITTIPENNAREEEEETETIDPESTCYIREMMEDWSSINFIESLNFTTVKKKDVSKNHQGEFWIQTSTNNNIINWLVDTGSPRSFVSRNTAKQLITKLGSKIIKQHSQTTEFRCFNNNKIQVEYQIQLDLTSGNSTAQNCQILVVPQNTVNLLGRDVLQKLGLQLTFKNTGEKIHNINSVQHNIAQWVFQKYPHLCTRIGKSRNHIAKSTFHNTFHPTQHKGRRVPLHLIDKVEKELNKLIEDKQIIKLDKCSDEYFISPVVITVKHDKSIKIALDSKQLNEAIHKNKYQMQSIDHLMDTIACKISELKQKPGTLYFSKIDLKYAYSQVPLHEDTQKHCNFNILGGNATGTYRFVNGFYGLTDMPATFQKIMDSTLANINSAHAFLDDILIITKGSLSDHETELQKVLSRLDEENLAISLHKCEFAATEITWLGYKINPDGIIPTTRKTEAIMKMETPKTLKQLRSLMGSIHHLQKFIPNLSNISAPLRPLLSHKEKTKNNKLEWNEDHTQAFQQIKNAIAKIIEHKHFDTNRPTRVRCDASKEGLGACLEQNYNNNWHPIAYASRFLNSNEQKYSINELELLSVVWSLEHFKYYLYGSRFMLQTDHQALLSALKNNRGNKTYQSRLTRWVDRLLPFNFSVEHIAGKNMGFADYFSRHPTSAAIPISKEDKDFVINLIDSFKFMLKRADKISSNRTALIKQADNDVIIASEQKRAKQSAFSQIHSKEQSHYIDSKFVHSNSTIYNTVNVCTRNKPSINTYEQKITKRFRRPNKGNMETPKLSEENPHPTNNTQHQENITNKKAITIGTQTDYISNQGQGLKPLDPNIVENPFNSITIENSPDYLLNLHKVLGEAFIAEATKNDTNSSKIRRLIELQDWNAIKNYSKYWYSLRKDLSVNPNGCILYDGKMYIPTQLRKTVIDSVHKTHPGQAGMMYLAQLIWYPQIHRDIVALAQRCKQCTKTGKNLKPILPRNKYAKLPTQAEPNEEIQMDFAGPITNNNRDTYILVTVDRYSRYPHAEIYNNCDTNTAINYLKDYIKFHGIPRSLRCDQAQAFKAKNSEIFCKDNNIRLILAPAGDHRGTGMVERLIQTIKRRLAAINADNNWSKETLANKISAIIENIKLIPNTTTKITPFEAHFGRKPNTQTSNIVTHPHNKNLSYKNIRKFYLDKRVLRRPMLDQQAMWTFSDSEPNIDIQYNTPDNSEDESDTIPLARQRATKRKHISPTKIIPDKLSITFGDKTSVLINKRKQIARKTLMRKAPEPRGTLKPLWNIIPDGTISDYTPTTISLDTHNRANTRIRKSDLAIATETYEKPTPPHTQEPKPRLMHFVACKTVREYNRNREKIRKFCLEEKKQPELKEKDQRQREKETLANPHGPVTSTNQDPAGPSTSPTQHQTGPSTKKQSGTKQKGRTERKRKALSPSKRPIRPTKNKSSTFEQKSKEAAIAQTKLTIAKRSQQAKQKQHPLIHMDLSTISNSKTIEVVNIASDSSNTSPIRIITSSSPKDFMNHPSQGPTPKSPLKYPKKDINNIVEQIKAAKQQDPQFTKDSDSDTDYANLITIKKASPTKTSSKANPTKDTSTPHPQHSSTPLHSNIQTHPQSAEHDSTSDIENEPQQSIPPENTTQQQQQHESTENTHHATKSLEQSPISSLNTEDMDELNKLTFE